MSYSCFAKLYNALVLPIITYGSAIWGDRSYSHIDAVHNRACRFFSGVGKYIPKAAIQGDMGWPLPIYNHWVTIVKQRLHRISDNRINKKVFMFCKSKSKARCKLCKKHDLHMLTDINDISRYTAGETTVIQLVKHKMLKLCA